MKKIATLALFIFSWAASQQLNAATPSTPSSLSANASSSSQINLKWTDNAGIESGFKIERKLGASGTYAQIATVSSNITSFASTGLVAKTQYYFRVRAYNSSGDSAYSNEATATTTSAAAASVINLPKGTGTEHLDFDASNVGPGSTLILEGRYSSARIKNLRGTQTAPIYIRNKGLVEIGGYSSYTFLVYGTGYKILGNSDVNYTYGFRIGYPMTQSGYAPIGISLDNPAYSEIAYCEFQKAHCGIICNPTNGNVMANNRFHHNYIHDLDNPSAGGRTEAFYLGNTSTNVPYNAPYRWENCVIENNLVQNTSGDGIQVCDGTFTIRNNTVDNYGKARLSGQRSGILIGEKANATVYQNTVKNGHSIALQIFGYGTMNVYSNQFTNIDTRGLSTEDIVYSNARIKTGMPLFKINYHDNTVTGYSDRYGVHESTPDSYNAGCVFSNNVVTGTFGVSAHAVTSKDIWK